jgi:hypothetical protein
MRTLLTQIEAASTSRLYYLALISALAVPDIAGALEADDGRATGQRYSAWYETWARPIFRRHVIESLPANIRGAVQIENPLSGEECYFFRCSLLHQGSSQHSRSGFSRILFFEPGATTTVMHYCQVRDALMIDLPMFCSEVTRGARAWLEQVEGTEPFATNYDKYVRRHDSGLAPYIQGAPVIG